MISARTATPLQRHLPTYLTTCRPCDAIPTRRVFKDTPSRNTIRTVNTTSKEDIFSQLAAVLPAFPLEEEDTLRIINEPALFFEELKSGIDRSIRRIFLATLYLGNEPTSCELISRLDHSLKSKGNLNVAILQDFLRGTRGYAKSEKEKRNINSSSSNTNRQHTIHHLAELSRIAPDRTNFYFYHTPKLNGLLKKILPERINEVTGVQHIKIFIFDDDIMISGANLSEQYFTNRQDRYILIKNNTPLSDFYHDLLSTIGSFSYYLSYDGRTQLRFPQGIPLPDRGMAESKKFIAHGFQKISSLLEKYQKFNNFTNYISNSNNNNKDNNNTNNTNNNNTNYNNKDKMYTVGGGGGVCKTWIFPTLQIGPLGICDDQRSLLSILESAPSSGSKLTLSTPYFNLYSAFERAIARNLPKYESVTVIAASQRANGFYGSKGISSIIPQLYSYALANTFKNETSIHRLQYDRPNWTYHAKGLWITSSQPQLALPNLLITVVGSSNYGTRSVTLDMESQLILLSTSPSLMNLFEEERSNLMRFVNEPPPSPPTFTSSLFLSLLWPIIKNFL